MRTKIEKLRLDTLKRHESALHDHEKYHDDESPKAIMERGIAWGRYMAWNGLLKELDQILNESSDLHASYQTKFRA